MTAPSSCPHCGGTKLTSAHLEHGLNFCIDSDAHHGVRRVGLRATICEDCGHTDFWAKDPARALQPHAIADHSRVVQEEDF